MSQPNSRSYIIAATPRSGSYFLCDLLTLNGIGRPGEDLNPYPIRSRISKAIGDGYLLDDLLPALRVEKTVGGFYGIKLMSEWVDMLRSSARIATVDWGQFFATYFPNAYFIFLRRRDRVRQAISLLRAKSTGQWVLKEGEQKAAEKAELTLDAIHSAVLALQVQELQWRQYFQLHMMDPHFVYYEDLIADPAPVITSVARGLGAALHEVKIGSTHVRQADEMTEHYVRLYRELQQS